MVIVQSLNTWFEEELRSLKCQDATRSYIVALLSQYRNQTGTLESFTLAFKDARDTGKFDKFQALGDWLFWLQAMSPDSIDNTQRGYVSSLAQLSYATCNRLLNNKWPLFSEMATRYFELAADVNAILKKKSQ